MSSDDGSDQLSDRCGSYSLSADVSESESCSSFSCRRFDGEGASSSMASSPHPVSGNFCFPPPVSLPVIGGKDVLVWDGKAKKRDDDLSGNFFVSLLAAALSDQECTIKIRTHSFSLLEISILSLVVFCAEVEMMKERFAKLLLGEDMSGGGKGVCTALAISNAITNLSGRSSI